MKQKKRIIGAGFSGLDIIRSEQINYLPGGTCANVLAVLASLGWSAKLLKARYDDPWNAYVNDSLKGIGVDIIEYGTSNGAIPRVVQVNTVGCHYFHTVCPECNKKLINIRMPTAASIKNIGAELVNFDILFYDRISVGTKSIAKTAKDNSIWTFYEPNSSRSYSQLFSNAAEADIVKFSAERIPLKIGTALKEGLSLPSCNTKLLIITLGEKGIAYSLKDETNKFCDWYHLNAITINNAVDTSGAGDWLTAGFVDAFIENYPNATSEISHEIILRSLQNGQQISQKGCEYLGALGALFMDNRLEVIIDEGACKYCLV